SIDDDYYEYLENQFALVGSRTRKRFQLGDPVTIRVASVSVEERMADFELLEHAGLEHKSAPKEHKVFKKQRRRR
ncbi:MAG TPA: hypothetical protein DHU63_10580, partial [Candidatus Marinimicrobia bacterium]|nr:hypothetical protein [Candidatus Neomarinimicrobiota bacterium]